MPSHIGLYNTSKYSCASNLWSCPRSGTPPRRIRVFPDSWLLGIFLTLPPPLQSPTPYSVTPIFSPKPLPVLLSLYSTQHCAFRMETFRVHDKTAAPGSITFRFVFNPGSPSQAVLDATHIVRRSSTSSTTIPETTSSTSTAKDVGSGEDPQSSSRPAAAVAGEEGGKSGQQLSSSVSSGLKSGSGSMEERITMTLGGMYVPHSAGTPHECHIRQVGTVTFNPRKQVRFNIDFYQ